MSPVQRRHEKMDSQSSTDQSGKLNNVVGANTSDMYAHEKQLPLSSLCRLEDDGASEPGHEAVLADD